jgi:hypothetical protein
MMSEQIETLLLSDEERERERAIEELVRLLTSTDRDDRLKGYAMFRERLNEALYRSCLNYRSLVGGFTHPLATILARAIEAWARGDAHRPH